MQISNRAGWRGVLTLCSVLLVLLSISGFVYSIRAEVAELHYHAARYGRSRNDIEAVLAHSAAAHRIYPHNYYLCIWAGKTAFAQRGTGTAVEESRLKDARFWADEGYACNPHNSELVHLKTEVLALSSVFAALAVWEPYVERRFWEPFNHFVLVDLYTRSGELEKAEESLFWLQDNPLFKSGSAILAAAWRNSLSDH